MNRLYEGWCLSTVFSPWVWYPFIMIRGWAQHVLDVEIGIQRHHVEMLHMSTEEEAAWSKSTYQQQHVEMTTLLKISPHNFYIFEPIVKHTWGKSVARPGGGLYYFKNFPKSVFIIRVSQKKSEFRYVTLTTASYRLDEPPEKNWALYTH